MGGDIYLTGPTGPTEGLANYAFSMPRDGTLTSFSAYFSVPVDFPLNGDDYSPNTLTIQAQVYTSAPPSGPNDTFSPITPNPAIVTLSPTLSGAPSGNIYCHGATSGLNISLATETRVLVVFSMTASGPTGTTQYVQGLASAGITIQ